MQCERALDRGSGDSPGPPLTSCMTLGKLLYLSGSQFPYLEIRDIIIPSSYVLKTKRGRGLETATYPSGQRLDYY